MTQFFREFDVNGDGVFDFGEFSKMMHAALDGHGVLDDDPALGARRQNRKRGFEEKPHRPQPTPSFFCRLVEDVVY